MYNVSIESIFSVALHQVKNEKQKGKTNIAYLFLFVLRFCPFDLASSSSSVRCCNCEVVMMRNRRVGDRRERERGRDM